MMLVTLRQLEYILVARRLLSIVVSILTYGGIVHRYWA